MTTTIDLSKFISSIKVSSTLDDDDQFSKEHLIDSKMETCWNSDEGEKQFVFFKFNQPVTISHFELTFQGGFGASHIDVSVGVPITTNNDNNDDQNNNDDDDAGSDDDDQASPQANTTTTTKRQIGLKSIAQFTSQDASSTQSFSFTAKDVYAVKITFTEMADMFGRVIIYNLNVFGTEGEVTTTE